MFVFDCPKPLQQRRNIGRSPFDTCLIRTWSGYGAGMERVWSGYPAGIGRYRDENRSPGSRLVIVIVIVIVIACSAFSITRSWRCIERVSRFWFGLSRSCRSHPSLRLSWINSIGPAPRPTEHCGRKRGVHRSGSLSVLRHRTRICSGMCRVAGRFAVQGPLRGLPAPRAQAITITITITGRAGQAKEAEKSAMRKSVRLITKMDCGGAWNLLTDYW